ncbi:uncharacterized protein LOC124606809 [Schistocerca americana]|uniref:uncharacterized protein LOC124606809 n=1 Tax=Schistocerca americana TaxID=7009 RepID=UPI001F4F66F5|nr:uncharacterized protein LOC124606809 [Schistocerca americana]
MLSPLMLEAAAVEEQPPPPGLQRLWARRGTLTAPPPPEEELLEDIFPPAQAEDELPVKPRCCSPQPVHAAPQLCEICQGKDAYIEKSQSLYLDGAVLRDIPARYVIPALKPHEIPAVGVWVDPRIVPGFRYRVHPLSSQSTRRQKYLFGGRALVLESIGRGYSRRLTFQADENNLNENCNYFWADSNPEGFAFEIEAVSAGDKFTLHDANHLPIASLEVLQCQKPQEEVRHTVLDDGVVEKTIRVRALCKAEWFDDGQAPPVVPVDGLAVVTRSRGAAAANVVRLTDVRVGSHHKRGFTLEPGVDERLRCITVRCDDIPTAYTVTGLEAYELPVVGTYVDPRIAPGFCYRVRPAGSKRHLFGGRALRLLNIGMGYGKRITFAPDPDNLNEPANYFWSDSHPDGVGFEPRAVHTGMRFAVVADGQRVGEASVFRADAAQQEEKQELVKLGNKTALTKYIHVDVTCHVSLSLTDAPEPHVMRVSGTAIIRRDPGQTEAKLIKVENVGLSSQLNILFVIQETHLEFHPL